MKIILAALAASLIGTAAGAAECNSFVMKTNKSVTIERSADGKSVVMSDAGEQKRYDVAVQKYWGELTEVAVDTSGETRDAFPMRMLNVDGKDSLVFASTVFLTNCQ